jgi:hypothetical protein
MIVNGTGRWPLALACDGPNACLAQKRVFQWKNKKRTWDQDSVVESAILSITSDQISGIDSATITLPVFTFNHHSREVYHEIPFHLFNGKVCCRIQCPKKKSSKKKRKSM